MRYIRDKLAANGQELPNLSGLDKAITLGHPSYVWRAGQERRLEMIRRHAPLEGARILDVGCGLGTYVRAFRRFSDQVYGVDVDPEKVAQASQELPHIQTAPAEELPFADGFFDVVLLHEVLEHVDDDRQAVREAHRVTQVGGRMVVFAPNRLWLWETHGVFWRGQYHFGNIPLVNYLPNPLRNKLAGHVRVYTGRGLRRLFHGLPGRVLHHSTIYPGFDNLAARRPALARLVRGVAYAFEKMPLLRSCGLSHFLVVQKVWFLLGEGLRPSPSRRRSGDLAEQAKGGLASALQTDFSAP